MTEANTKTTNKLVVVPSAWVVYEIPDEGVESVRRLSDAMARIEAPSVAVMEALVMVGKAKRVAAVHTFNAMSSEDEGDSESPFTEHEQE